MIVLTCYFLMLVFDAAVLAGTTYLVGWQDWDPLWFLFALIVMAGSNPKNILAAVCT